MREIVALLGRRDTPTDGVEDYCTFLGEALARHGVELRQVRVAWTDKGWLRALRMLLRDAKDWRGTWVILQYTALAWSRRGLPFGALAVMRVLRRRGARCAVVFHEPGRQQHGEQPRWRDRTRGLSQDFVVQRLYSAATKSVFTIPLTKVAWLPDGDRKAEFIPIGANIPERFAPLRVDASRDAPQTVAVFCVSHGANRDLEIADIACAARRARKCAGAVDVVILGKGSVEAKRAIERALNGDVPVTILGRLPAEQVSETLSKASALLYVYGCVSQNRGSALAGIACGLPIVGYSGKSAGTPLEEAGLQLVPYRNREALGEALARVLSDRSLLTELQNRSRAAQERYFSWAVISSKYLRALGREAPEQ